MLEREETDNFFRRIADLLSRRRMIIAACITTLLFPFPTTVVPEWRLRVMDEQGQPLARVRARQSWKHYSLEWEGCCSNEEDRWTDETGYVVFPKRTIWAGLLRRAIFPIWAKALTIMHGSTGIHANVMLITDEFELKVLRYEQDKPLPEIVVLR